MKSTSLGIAILLALAACQGAETDKASNAIDSGLDAADVANADIETLPPDETTEPAGNAATDETEDAPEESPSTAMIPAQYRGRWGLVPADCEPGRSDAKGLMTVGDKTLSFYESRAALQEQRPAIAISFSGLFVFTGEGQTWERVVTLTRTGDTLKRAQADGTFTYTRCP